MNPERERVHLYPTYLGRSNYFFGEFHQSVEELVEILFVNNYFGFESDCQIYGDRIYDFVVNNINFPTSRISPQKFKKYGEKYLKYTANKRTTWYIFFDQKDHRFLVNHILNNHSQDFPELL